MARKTARHNVKRHVVAIVIIAVFGSWFGSLTFADEPQKLSDAFKQLNELKEEMAKVNAMKMPVGTIMPYAGSREKNEEKLRAKGWLFCHGDKLDREKYKELYLVIQTAFGNPDPDNKSFNLPDLRGRFVRGVDHGAGRDPDVGKRTSDKPHGHVGGKVGSVQEDVFMSHKHTIKAQHSKMSGGRSKGDPPAVAGWPNNPADKQVESSGGAETRPKNIYVNWLIKARK